MADSTVFKSFGANLDGRMEWELIASNDLEVNILLITWAHPSGQTDEDNKKARS